MTTTEQNAERFNPDWGASRSVGLLDVGGQGKWFLTYSLCVSLLYDVQRGFDQSVTQVDIYLILYFRA